ncbi:hypothetical protein M0804_000473 [Polistes exclamans]|nr:hypothetical protein M0804_000473 [Polistes exclamans]
MVWCGIVCGVMQCGEVWYGMVWYGMGRDEEELLPVVNTLRVAYILFNGCFTLKFHQRKGSSIQFVSCIPSRTYHGRKSTEIFQGYLLDTVVVVVVVVYLVEPL